MKTRQRTKNTTAGRNITKESHAARPNPNLEESNAQEKKVKHLMDRYEKAHQRRSNWDSLWQDAYDYTLPNRGPYYSGTRATRTPGQQEFSEIFDATAMDAVDQLAASILGNLTPPWSQWFGLKPGPDLSPAQNEALAPVLEKAGKTLQDHFDRSNFAVEIHQSFLDLIIGGTACLHFDEATPGEFSAFKFTSVPLSQIVLEEGAGGILDGTFRLSDLTLAQIRERFPAANIPPDIKALAGRNPQEEFAILESLIPITDPIPAGYEYTVMFKDHPSGPYIAESRTVSDNPFINFRWMKTPDEIYGRSPVMKALPDIKTANKVVELVLKNASIAVTGIWQAEDDGVLNPMTVQLSPGSIIPKAVGSQGLTALDIPGRFDISELVLDDLRGRIRHALLVDRLTQINGRNMTATEVLERSAEMALVLGATYGRLQSELLIPLIRRAFSILRRRGEVPDIDIDGRLVQLDFRSPLARAQGQRDTQNTISWITTVLSLGGDAPNAVDLPRIARFLGEAMGVPSDLIRTELPQSTLQSNQQNNGTLQ